MTKIVLAVLALMWAATANAGQVIQPPGPLASPACGGGNSTLGYTAYGTGLTCGTALSSGSIANGATQLGVYIGLNAIGPLTGVNNGVLTFSSGGVPTPSTTLPASLTIPGYALLASPTFTGAPLAPTPTTGDNTTKIATTAYVKAQGYATTAAPTLTSPIISGANFSDLTNAPLLGTDVSGNLRAITLGTNLSLIGTTLNASGGPSGAVTWPAANSLVVSNSTNTPSGLVPVNNSLIYGSGNAWMALAAVASSVPCVNASSVLSMCSPATVQGILGYLTGNQTITLGGDATGSGTTSITVTVPQVNGVHYPASPLTNTIPYISSANQVTYGNAATILGVLGAPFSVPNGGWGLGTLTANAIYKGNGTSAPLVSGLSDTGSVISTSETFDLTNQSVVVEIANAASTGTTNGLLAKLTGAPSTAVTLLTSDTDGAIGLVLSGGGTTGNAQIVIGGQANCSFDGSTTASDWVIISSTSAGKCHDTGSMTRPGGSQVIGRVLSTNGGGAGSYPMIFAPQFTNTAGSAPTWPATGDIVVSNSTNTPAGIVPVNGDCIIGSGGAWVAGSCLGGGSVTSAGTSTVNNIPFWTGTDTLSNTGVPFGTTGNNTLAETLGTGLLSNAIINWAAPSAIGGTTPAAGAFTTLSASSTVSGTGFSTYLAAPPAIGGTTPAAGAFTTLSATGAVSGAGFNAYLASPPAIGGTAAGAGSFTTLSASSTVSGTGFSTYLASPPSIGATAPAAGKFTTLTVTGAITTTGLATGTQVSCLGLNASNVVVLAAAACGSGGGANTDTGTTGITAAGTTLAAATDLTTQQSYVASGANCTTLVNGCVGTAGVRFDAALMVAYNHLYVCNEDPTNALLVYPDTTGHTINNQAAGIGIPVPANQCGHFIVKSATALRTVP